MLGWPIAPAAAARCECRLPNWAFTVGRQVPRGVLHTHYTGERNGRLDWQTAGTPTGQRIQVATPVGHNAGYFYGVRLALQHGATMVLQDVWDAAEMARLVAQHHVTFDDGCRSGNLIDLLRVPDLERYDLSSLAVLCVVVPAFRQPGCHGRAASPRSTCPVFGMTEHGHRQGRTRMTPAGPRCARPTGRPSPEVASNRRCRGPALPRNVEAGCCCAAPSTLSATSRAGPFTDPFRPR